MFRDIRKNAYRAVRSAVNEDLVPAPMVQGCGHGCLEPIVGLAGESENRTHE